MKGPAGPARRHGLQAHCMRYCRTDLVRPVTPPLPTALRTHAEPGYITVGYKLRDVAGRVLRKCTDELGRAHDGQHGDDDPLGPAGIHIARGQRERRQVSRSHIIFPRRTQVDACAIVDATFRYEGDLSQPQAAAAQYVSFDELLMRSDVHCPLSEHTYHLIGKPGEFDKMKDNILVVNAASRGAVIDENALVEMLESGKVIRCALDVCEYDSERRAYAVRAAINPSLLKTTRATLLPHCAVVNETIQEDQQCEIMANLEASIKTLLNEVVPRN
ncbi:hypothetical protein FISHEDRAFT_74581 [Fistulina hepatica ATCC 64428]|uniref:D-isomer specific 2-hydroxyacid dehydrogenase NAD-binding domain-containing protein n=1 Tax=Fistulina hepatica ATCC 64428 TaxID=1128425 RepID=A0A0D7A9W7_9AGAR|nr:hypothetical protein FISHEDRAFT_74581 [Fistulina hepatica ATCC 64428]